MASLSSVSDNFDFAHDPVTRAPVTLSPRAVVIAGRSGTGKSALIQRFALQYASSDGGFIVCDPSGGAEAARERYLRTMVSAGREHDFILIDFDDREARGTAYSSDRDDLQVLARAVVQEVMGKAGASFNEVLEHKRCTVVCLPAFYPPAFNRSISRVIFDDLACALKERVAQGMPSERFFVGLDEPFFLWAETDAAEDLRKVSEATGAAGVGLVFASHSSYRLVKSWPTKVVLGGVLDKDIDDVLDFLCPSVDETFAISDIRTVLRSLTPREALVADAHRLARVSIPPQCEFNRDSVAGGAATAWR